MISDVRVGYLNSSCSEEAMCLWETPLPDGTETDVCSHDGR